MLLEKSKSKQVNWMDEPKSPMAAGSQWFRVLFSDCIVRTGRVSPPTDADYYRTQIWNKAGRVVAEWTASEEGDPLEGETLMLLRSLYEEAERSVTGWDEVLSSLKSELSRDGFVGLF